MFSVYTAKMMKHAEHLMTIYVTYSYDLVLFLNKQIFVRVYGKKH
jgi:hypothetical protein